MNAISVKDPAIILLADGTSDGARANGKGHLFEQFMARVMEHLGYKTPTRLNLNVTSEGVELDISLTHTLDQGRSIAECKAYTTNVPASMLSAFYGKLAAERLTNDDATLRGFFFAIPRLTGDAAEKAQAIQERDSLFRALAAVEIWDLLCDREVITPIAGELVSDHALIVHESGIYSAALVVDAESRTASHVLIHSAAGGPVPAPVLALLTEHPYSQGLSVRDATSKVTAAASVTQQVTAPLVVEVHGSHSDFEYQLPASPKYFVGRRDSVRDLVAFITTRGGSFVLNAQSGWGKSSLALKVAAENMGVSLVLDTRTATAPSYVTAAIRKATEAARDAGLLNLGHDANWASTSGALRSLEEASWLGDGHLLVIFDQFENVFADPDLTREFRDLALWNSEHREHVTFGFAWKTDYVDWIENHPYRLRDQIRESAKVVHLAPFGSREVDTILARLESTVTQKLSRELRQRLREYSQGLPWLLKKLSGHVIRELSTGKTQEQLVGEALNVQNLFDSDLQALSPKEREALNFVARYAPVRATEVTERFQASLVQSLLNQRLIVQVGEKLDTYWDIFRDYLNTGRVPIADSYILRLSPNSVARLVSELLAHSGAASTSEIADAWDSSEGVVWNAARELRQLGLASSSNGQIALIPDVVNAEDPEAELRTRVATALRRHKAFAEFINLADKGQGHVSASGLADRLREAFPAVEGTDGTWMTYARTFAAWLEYAGLAVSTGTGYGVAVEGSPGRGQLTTKPPSIMARGGSVFPNIAPGPALEMLRRSGDGPVIRPEGRKKHFLQLLALGAVLPNEDSTVFKPAPGLVVEGEIAPLALLELLLQMPGGSAAVERLRADPAMRSQEMGTVFETAYGTSWSDSTKELVGKSFFAWARAAGIPTKRRSRRSSVKPTASAPGD